MWVGKAKNRDSISGSIVCREWFDRQVQLHAAAPDRGKLITLVAGKRRRLFFTVDDDKIFMTSSLNVTSKTTEQHLIVRIHEADVTITKDCARCIVLLKLTAIYESSRVEKQHGIVVRYNPASTNRYVYSQSHCKAFLDRAYLRQFCCGLLSPASVI